MNKRKIVLPKVLIYEIILFLPGDIIVNTYTKVNKLLSDDFFINLYLQRNFPSFNLAPLNLTRREKLNLLLIYPDSKHLDMLDFEGYYTDGSFYGNNEDYRVNPNPHVNKFENIF